MQESKKQHELVHLQVAARLIKVGISWLELGELGLRPEPEEPGLAPKFAPPTFVNFTPHSLAMSSALALRLPLTIAARVAVVEQRLSLASTGDQR